MLVTQQCLPDKSPKQHLNRIGETVTTTYEKTRGRPSRSALGAILRVYLVFHRASTLLLNLNDNISDSEISILILAFQNEEVSDCSACSCPGGDASPCVYLSRRISTLCGTATLLLGLWNFGKCWQPPRRHAWTCGVVQAVRGTRTWNASAAMRPWLQIPTPVLPHPAVSTLISKVNRSI